MAQRRIGARSYLSFQHTRRLKVPRLATPSPSAPASRGPNSTRPAHRATTGHATIPIAAPPSEPGPRFPCMGRLLSSATCLPLRLALWPSVGAKRRRYGERHGLGTRTGQGRKPRSGRAQARALTRSIPSPPASGGINLVKPTNGPSGAMPRARVIAPQPCIRWVYITRTMMQSCASAAKLRSGGPILPSGMKAKETHRDPATSNRHRRTVTRGRTGPNLSGTFSVLRSCCGTQNDAFGHSALPHEPP